MKKSIFIILALTMLAGCSIKIVPEPVASGTINEKANSITLSKDKTVVTMAPADPNMLNYNLDSPVASFSVEIQNNGDREISFDTESFILVDSNKRQYYALTPEKIRQMLARDTYYLLPYPYVGFYYLEDYQLAEFKNSTNSNLPYYFELRPQDIYTKALSTEAVIPNAGIKGLVYFNVDVESLTSFRINLYRKGDPKSSEPALVFPFKVVK
jgi:putative VirB-like lipoprotein